MCKDHTKDCTEANSYKYAWLGVDVTDLTNLVVVNHHYGAVVQEVPLDAAVEAVRMIGLPS